MKMNHSDRQYQRNRHHCNHDHDHRHRQQQQQQQQQQGQQNQSNVIVDWRIREHDVLCGRHRSSTSHPGNIRFRAIVKSHCGRYQSTIRRQEKADITNEVIGVVEAEGGRFLRRHVDAGENNSSRASSSRALDGTEFWVPLEPSEVHEKVSHALRSSKNWRRRNSSSGGTTPSWFSFFGTGASEAVSTSEELADSSWGTAGAPSPEIEEMEEEMEVEEALRRVSDMQQHLYSELVQQNCPGRPPSSPESSPDMRIAGSQQQEGPSKLKDYHALTHPTDRQFE